MKKYRDAVFILTYAQTEKGIRYLILRRKLHWVGWEFPKGGVKFLDFTKPRTVKRELKEETGLKPIEIEEFDICGKYYYEKEFKDRRGFKGQSFKLFVVKVEQGKVRLDKREHSAYGWATYAQAVKKLTWRNQRDCLMKVNKYLTENQKVEEKLEKTGS